jgi:DNA-binding CsgD family transcriptional regulator
LLDRRGLPSSKASKEGKWASSGFLQFVHTFYDRRRCRNWRIAGGHSLRLRAIAPFPIRKSDFRLGNLTTYTGDVQILRAMKVGARAYLLKSLLDRELLETIRAVHAGRKTLSPEASYELAEHAADEVLTPTEIEVLRLIAAGNGNKQIAAQLSITEESVKGRVKSILSKLGANDRTHAAMIGVKRGIIESWKDSRKTLHESDCPHIIPISGGSLCCAAKDSGG